jgi:choline dehydrogenase-like flavoprotein
MIVSIHTLPADQVFDVCIAGSGPAGMTLALALAEKGKTVLLLEGGDMEFSEDWQRLYVGQNVGDRYHDLDVVRLRQLGGTSNHWGGWCRPLDAIDFEYKDHCPNAHWPIQKSDLDPYLDRSLDILGASGPIEDQRLNDALQRIIFRISDPTMYFSSKYADVLATSQNLILAIQCSLIGIDTDRARIRSFRVRDLAGVSRDVRADVFVLACGGIENNRLLLHFNSICDRALVPDERHLGRYWMEHPTFTVGEVFSENEGDEQTAYFALTPERMREARTLNCGLRLEWTRDRGGLRKLAHDLGCVAPKLGEWIYRRMNKPLICAGALRAAWEQEPNPDSRVRLSADRRDAFGMPMAVLDWRKTPRDISTVRTAAIELGAYLARADLGRMMLHDWVLNGGPWPENDEFGGYHHLGGTRMSDGPETGIVDHDLRLWSQDNLYIAGSSVFPSGGHANPTLTIVQMSLRLADHLS